MNQDLDKKIESYLFWKNEPVFLKDLMNIFKVEKNILMSEIEKIQNRYTNSGISLKMTDDKIVLTTNQDTSEMIQDLIKNELNKDLSKATLETLAIVIYRGPLKRAEIDYIRGVSSQFILRNLQIRGLIEKIDDPKDSRSYLYKPSIELLNYLGINTISEMPEYASVNEDIDKYLESENESLGDSKQEFSKKELEQTENQPEQNN
jgi:segregation and condensation protein B